MQHTQSVFDDLDEGKVHIAFMAFPPERLKNLPPNFMMEHLFQGLYGVDADDSSATQS